MDDLDNDSGQLSPATGTGAAQVVRLPDPLHPSAYLPIYSGVTAKVNS